MLLIFVVPVMVGHGGEGELTVSTMVAAFLGSLLLIGGIGYAFRREWGRRIADAGLWALAVAISFRAPVSRYYLQSALLWICFAIWWRLELWQPDVLTAFGVRLPAQPRRLRLALLARMLAASVAAAILSFYLRRP